MAKSKRRSGLDLYKILAMLMVTILHTLGRGGYWRQPLAAL